MNNDKDRHYLENRLLELANISYERNVYTHTDFLNINELNIFNNIKSILPPVNVNYAGGNNYAERKIIVFSPIQIYYEFESPISVLKISPINLKYTDGLTHRDFLGAILNLGIVRSKIGDIFVKNNTAYVYCMDDMSQYITENLKKIKHTLINIDYLGCEEIQFTPYFKEITGTIANIRLDSLVSTAFGTSRNSVIFLIEGGKVFVNNRLTTSNGTNIKKGDVISVRGKGRFIFDGLIKTTKKGRNLIKLRLYL